MTSERATTSDPEREGGAAADRAIGADRATDAEHATGAEHAAAAELQGVLEELQRREPILHRLELGTDRAAFERQTAPDFWEVGASGSIYSREVVWSTLEPRYAAGEDDTWMAEGFLCRELSPSVYLLTYLLHQGARKTRRATIWERTEDGWRIVYHQGTIIADHTTGA